MAKVKAGEGPCPVCGERIVWRESESGALSCFCQDCDFQGYAKDGTEAKRRILAAHGLKKPEAAPAPEPKASPFGVFGL
jgi:hypothetical protein